MLAVIEEALQLSEETGRWAGTREPRPELVITDVGREEANRVLAERGERWWLRSTIAPLGHAAARDIALALGVPPSMRSMGRP